MKKMVRTYTVPIREAMRAVAVMNENCMLLNWWLIYWNIEAR